MTRRLAVLLALGAMACGGRQRPTTPAPQTPNESLAQFLNAVKANDLTRMGNLWGNDRGPAAGWMDQTKLAQRLGSIQKYLDHVGYRVIDGPAPAHVTISGDMRDAPSPDRIVTFRVELQREQCNRVLPIDVFRTTSGGWLVWDVHLESAGNPRSGCQPPTPGTRD